MAAARPKRIVILNCEDAPKWKDYIDIFEAAFPLPSGWERKGFDLYTGDIPSKADIPDLNAIIVTGSHYSVNDEALAQWLLPTCQFIRDCHSYMEAHPEAEIRMLGICFGAQLIAKALGGEVGFNPSGKFVLQVENINFKPEFFDLCSQPSLSSLRLMESHGECVLTLPPTCTQLASSDSTKNEAFCAGNKILALQGHPELTMSLTEEKILPFLRKRLEDEGHWASSTATFEAGHDHDTLLQVLRHYLYMTDQ